MIELAQSKNTIIHPNDIVNALNIKDKKEALKICNLAYAWITALAPGSILETTFVNFYKIDVNTIIISEKDKHKHLIRKLHDLEIITVP
jgi:hypothetical protein